MKPWWATLQSFTKESGFPLAGIVNIDPVLSSDRFFEHTQHFETSEKKGYFGEMGYLSRGKERRRDPRHLFPACKSILAVALPYSAAIHGSNVPGELQFARYLRGRDYHDEVSLRLEDILQKFSRQETAPVGLTWKVCVDTSALLEKFWAETAGIGWIGKNSLLIHPKYGSYLYLGFALLSEEAGADPIVHPNFCGNCNRCQEACPTQAFPRPYLLDSNRCIAYWTLEKKGELHLSGKDTAAIGNRVAGCDICQEVCPFNFKRARAESFGDAPTGLSENLADWKKLTRDEYQAMIKDSALNRVKHENFLRNLSRVEENSKTRHDG